MHLARANIEQYRQQGYLCPIRVLAPEQAADTRARLEAAEAANRSGPLGKKLNQKPHLLFTWLNDLVRNEAVLDAVEDAIGPDILCWGGSFFTKEPRTEDYVSWHQDLTYWGLEPADIVTAWVALSPSTPESGCMRVVPGSHHQDVIPHTETFAATNLLSRGQEVQVEVDEATAVDLVLQPGEMSLHHVKLIHGSNPNRSDDRRIGYAIRYIPTSVRQTAGAEDSAMLVRGVDRYRNFIAEQPPAADLDEGALAEHAAVLARQHKILYRGTELQEYR
jgi:ectoine hydroxylase-related dioxygenase (phytanoyl-CoA dioxygenase family)